MSAVFPQATPAVKHRAALIGWLKPLVFVLCLIPFIRLLSLGFELGGDLGANPIEFVTRDTGTWTLVLLLVTLTVTPLRRVTGWNQVIQLRRMLGLFAFFYGCLHAMTWVWFDQWFDLRDMISDVIKRPFITAGFFAFVMMIPLALTSNRFAIRKLGPAWSRLHKLVYLVAIAGVLHFWWHKAGKNALQEPMIYAAVLSLLFAARLIYWWRGKRRSSANKLSADSRSRTR